MSETDERLLIPELGDLLTIVSEAHGSTTGRIVFRDGSLIRIRPIHVSDRAIDFPLDQETGLFREALGVTEIIMHRKARAPHFSVQLAVLPGERLEFFSTEGQPIGEPGVVQVVLATEEQDAIQLEDGRILNFGFIGPEAPIAVIVPRAAPEDAAEVSNNSEHVEEVPAANEEEFFPEIDFAMLPTALVEEIPTSERTYSDPVQREDMYTSLLLDVSANQQKNPRVLRNLYRKTDLLLALKNSVVVRDSTGGIVVDQHRSYEARTLKEALVKQPTGSPLAALLPVAAVKRVLFSDMPVEGNQETSDVVIRNDLAALTEATNSVLRFNQTATDQGNAFLSYLDTLLGNTLTPIVPSMPSMTPPPRIRVDQDVLHTKIPTEAVTAIKDIHSTLKNPVLDVAAEAIPQHVDTSMRLLAPTVYTNNVTGTTYQLAPADVATTVAHIVLSPEVAAYRAPIRSSVLLWDIDASERSRSHTKTLYRTLMERWETQKVLGTDEEDVDVAEEVEGRIPPILSIHARPVVQTLDALGFANLEIDSPIMDVLIAAIERGRQQWDVAISQMRKRVLELMEKDRAPVLDAVASEDPLWSVEAVLQQPMVAEALEVYKAREPTLADTRLGRAAYFGKKANGTLQALWFAVAAQASTDALQTATDTFVAERRRLVFAEENRRFAEQQFTAAPEINPCPHVHILESIRSIREESKRMVMLNDFVAKYRAGQKGNWILCGSCEKPLVCRHEILLLHEYNHPGRGVALHKALLLEFGGPVFEGGYICKNCGQRISDLEYDTHMEFDDEGRPLVGRAVVQDTEDVDEAGLSNTLAEEGVDVETQGFTNKEDLKLFYLARTILEFCGISPTPDMYKRIVESARDFVANRIPTDRQWELGRQTEAAKKQIPPYATHKANLTFGVLGALVVLEILTTDVAIPFPAHGCVFQRGGFPLETEGAGTLTYVACVIAGIARMDEPWTLTSWSAETATQSGIEKRKNLVMAAMRQGLMFVLAIQPAKGKGPPPLTTVTDMYTTALEETRQRRLQADFEEDATGLPSRADRVPASFKPLQVQPKEMGDAAAIRNVAALERDVGTKAISEVLPVVKSRVQQLVREQVGAFHGAALTSAKSLHVLSASSPRSDSVCCFQRLGAVAVTGLGVRGLQQTEGAAAETEVLVAAAKQVYRRDPVSSANGTHFYVPWSAPEIVTQQPTPDASTYYRLFLKCCFRGENMGGNHEFGEDDVCRQCLFRLPAAFRYLTVSELSDQNSKKLEKAMDEMAAQRRDLALAALAEQGIPVDETAFHALEDAIHNRKAVAAPVLPVAANMMELLVAMKPLVEGSAVLLSSAVVDWDLLQRTMTNIVSKQLSPESTERRRDFSGFATRYDDMLQAVEMQLKSLLGTRRTAALEGKVTAAMDGLMALTKDVEAAQAVRNLMTAVVVPAEQASVGFLNVKPKVTKWFPSVNRSHAELLQRIWEKQASITQRAIEGLELQNTAVIAGVRRILKVVASWMGGWLNVWLTHLRVNLALFSKVEYQILLRWSVLHAVAATLTPESQLYVSTAADVRRGIQMFFRDWWMDVLQTGGRHVLEYQMTAKEITEAILARTEKEKAYFIQRFDKLDKDMRRVELQKKKLKIGDWAVGTVKNLFSYDADFFEFERGQRAAMGIPEFAADITGAAGGAAENPYGFFDFGSSAEGGYDHRAVHDEDA